MIASRLRSRLLASAAALALLGLAGCSSDLPASTTQPVPAVVPELGVASDSLLVDQAARSIITTGWAVVVVEDPLEAAAEASAIAERAGGRVESSSTTAPSEYSGGSASLTLRVPAASLDAVLEDLAALGTLQSSSTSSQDVTMQAADLGARIGALETAIERLADLLTEADSTDALIQIETAMTDRQAELDSLRAQQRTLEDQVAMSALSVDFQTEPTEPKSGPDDFLGGIVAGWEALVAFGAGLLVVGGVLLPWLIPIAIVVVIVWLIVRAVRRRKPAAQPTPPPPAGPAPTASEPMAPRTDDRGWPTPPAAD